MRDATRMSLQESHDKQRNFKMNRYIQQKVSDVHHAAAYDARVKELEHISYRVGWRGGERAGLLR